ncbi:2-oxoglutarate (2OG) and Fe(II)-dependent oxygenase superfamily [Raphidocelis subcapitata]|uniref:2-oxoglutarate (2OG) and Fe(II)-dependent oxygenase superfamily n=1 Tax=Raphidocelis subcapitata TaxID=307507 RepID=A0A2V0P248_9CHLO|nr:2-oxoglutarate (2OG) and Fe(II)-dependent oxygenase superfamily [Raphidocelis subcapitata]|eukprot:GBF93946.1 2-oxoglutarate (2OG) and Fe(II)-dependent oxygenase superfamily [Raphidocelis subcapitata]
MPPRVVLDDVLPRPACTRLSWLLQALSHDGHSPCVSVVTAYELARCEPRLLPELAAARQTVLQAVEASFGLEAELYVEWSGLVAWRPGAAIDWHHDANRDYLQQRAYAAVLYLNDAGAAFGGGALRFRSGAPARVEPRAGRLAAYGAGEGDAHRVEPVEWGSSRDTLTVWLSRDPAHCEDRKLLELLAAQPAGGLGVPASMWQAHAAGGGAEGGGHAGGGGGADADQQHSGGGGGGGGAGDGAQQSSGGAYGSGPADAGPAGEEAEADVRVQRLAGLGLAVELPGGLEGRAGLRAAGSDGSCHWCAGLQEASLLAHWLAGPGRDCAGGSGEGGPGGGSGCGGLHASGAPAADTGAQFSPQSLQRGASQLQRELEAGGRELERLLPAWRAHGFLVC